MKEKVKRFFLRKDVQIVGEVTAYVVIPGTIPIGVTRVVRHLYKRHQAKKEQPCETAVQP